jgi:hypothetical protein
MKLLFPVLAASAISLAAPTSATSATLSREPDGNRANGRNATNAPASAEVAGMIALPERDSDAATGATGRGTSGGGSIQAGGDAGMLFLVHTLRRSDVDSTFVADTTARMEGSADAGMTSASQQATGGEAEAAIQAMQQSGVVAVPEPSTYALLGAGALLLALRKRLQH